MKKVAVGVLFVLLTFCLIYTGPGCGNGKREEKGRVVARINDYRMSDEDFVDEVEHSSYLGQQSKDIEALLDLAVKRQILIQEAQRRGLHRQPEFVKTIERYWKQTLIKELLKDQSAEISRTVSEEKQDEALAQWLERLYEKADIEINEEVVKELKQRYE